MAKQTPSTINLHLPLLLLLTIFIVSYVNVAVAKVEGGQKSEVKLFVFGDKYLDTGNDLRFKTYKPPYGITFPGKPSGRFSDGRVLTDYVASFLKIKTPALYALINSSNLQYGVNFADGKSGIFNLFYPGLNMTAQIDSFEKLINQKVYTKHDLESSLALVHGGSDDYFQYQFLGGDITHVEEFMKTLIKQTSSDLRRIHSLGVGKIAVALLEPMGCLPHISRHAKFKKCDESYNSVSKNHSQLLLKIVQELNHEIGKSVFVTLDIYNSFLSTIATMQKKRSENSTLMNPLLPCCLADDRLYYICGSVDNKGKKHYSVCAKPELSFFFDNFNPSQNGWNEVFKMLQSSLQQLNIS